MKKTKFTAILLSAALLLASCGTMNNTAKGTAIGGGGGAAVGAIIGGLIGKGNGALIGAAIGGAVGAGTGAVIGRKMDKKATAAAQIEGAEVEKVQDNNGLDAVKVSFDSGILFGFNSSALSDNSKKSLTELAGILTEDNTTDIAIVGHTDKVGTYDANIKVSNQRAESVEKFLKQCGVPSKQFKTVEGVGYDQYDETKTAAENRRVEIFMYASEQMIKDAEAEASQN
ncbi:MAG: OmpA family protein [Bacteroidaceae bacterium]|nr:OmpA family protein [Bacteroidaceae bacterium]